MFGTIVQHGKTNQNHHETVRYHFIWTKMEMRKKLRYRQVLVRMWRNWNPHTLLVGKWSGTVTLEAFWKFLKKLSKEQPHNSVIPVLLVIWQKKVTYKLLAHVIAWMSNGNIMLSVTYKSWRTTHYDCSCMKCPE